MYKVYLKSGNSLFFDENTMQEVINALRDFDENAFVHSKKDKKQFYGIKLSEIEAYQIINNQNE
jgi:hypothetical protein